MFFSARDRQVYLRWLAEYAIRYELEIWAYCLMTNHVHLLVLGHLSDSLSQGIGRTHGRYAQWQNRRHHWSGHFWSNRFYSTPLDESHLWAAVRYVELNPVRAGIVKRAEQYRWSSAAAHSFGIDDPFLAPSRPFPGPIQNWSEWLADGMVQGSLENLRKNTSTGRPSGNDIFISRLEVLLNRSLTPRRRQGHKSLLKS